MKRTPFFPNALRCMLALAGIISMQPLFARKPAPNQPDATIHPYALVKQTPTYRGGGIERFFGWMYEELQYPQEAIDKGIGGTVKVKFVVETDGTMGDVQIETPDERLSDEVNRVLKCAERWEPGRNGKRPARVGLHLTVRFNQKDTTVWVRRMPMFLGGDLQTFRKWIIGHTTYPPELHKQRISGQVLIAFVVEPDGSLSGIKPLESSHPDFTREVLRVMHSAPKWTPAIQNGKFVRFKYVLPVVFNLN